MLSEIVDLLKKIEKASGEGPVSDEHDSPQETTSHEGAEPLIGREDDKKKIIEKLFKKSECSAQCSELEKYGVSIVTVIGKRGIGKTALARAVFNELKEHFGERRWWICVSQRPNREDLLRKILKEVKEDGDLTKSKEVKEDEVHVDPTISKEVEEDEDLTSLSLNDLQERIQRELSKKGFLLVLDDIWEVDWWKEEVQGTLRGRATGGKILITSRNEDVCRDIGAQIHELKELDFQDSWKLFLRKAFGESQTEQGPLKNSIREAASRIVETCGGLPLVIETVASMMRANIMRRDVWESVANSWIWGWKVTTSSTNEHGDIPPGFILSYNDLSPPSKRCFLYCSIYPKGYEINKHQLVAQWVAHGLTGEENVEVDVEERGEGILNDLISRRLIEKIDEERVKMQGVSHDLALYIGGREYSCGKADSYSPATHYARHMSLVNVKDLETANYSALHTAKKLRTLLLVGRHPDKDAQHLTKLKWLRVLSKLKWLRVLSLQACCVELPDSLGGFPLLKYLDLSYSTGVEQLPSSIGELYNLQVLNLSHTQIKELPKEISKLCNLRHLGLEGTKELKFIAEGLGKLTNLRTLHRFLVCNKRGKTRGCNIRELGKLRKLKGNLTIGGLGGRSVKVKDANDASLEGKDNLIGVELDFRASRGDESTAANQSKLLRALQPPRGIKNLTICRYKGEANPASADLRTLTLKDCGGVSEIRNMPLLNVLKIENNHRLQTISGMAALKSLELRACVGLTELSDMAALEELTLDQCNGLEKVDGLHALKQLTILASIEPDQEAEDTPVRSLELPNSLPSLEELTVKDLSNWEGWPEPEEAATASSTPPPREAYSLPCLRKAHFNGCRKMQTEKLVDALSERGPLQQLTMLNCPSGKLRLELLERLPKLVRLELDSISTQLPPPPAASLPSLRHLILGDGTQAPYWGKVPEWVWALSQLEKLELKGFHEVTNLAGCWQRLQNLRYLHLYHLHRLESLLDGQQEINCLSRLENLKIDTCPRLIVPQALRGRLQERLTII